MPCTFVKICNAIEIPENRTGKKFELNEGEEIAVFRIQGTFYAVQNRCPHNQTKFLHEGMVSDDLYLECPVHGWRFHLETGMTHPDCKELGSKLKIFKTKVEDGDLYVELKDSSQGLITGFPPARE